MKKTIAIYFSDAEPMGYPFNKAEYLEAYRYVISQIEARGIEVRIVRANSYLQNGEFASGWRMDRDGELEAVTPIHADLIFNRDDKNTIPTISDCLIINHPDFDQLCVDKLLTAEEFPEMLPRTSAVNSYEECESILESWTLGLEDRIVLKKNFETEGRGVHVCMVRDVTSTLYDSWNDVLMQEFLDSSGGILGLTDGLHDLRVTVVDGVPINSFLRTPPPGSFIANVARGGIGRSVDLSQVPVEVLSLADVIIERFQKYKPCLFGADFIHCTQGYKLLELNSRPGLQHASWSSTYKAYNDAVVEMLVKAVSS